MCACGWVGGAIRRQGCVCVFSVWRGRAAPLLSQCNVLILLVLCRGCGFGSAVTTGNRLLPVAYPSMLPSAEFVHYSTVVV